MSNNDIAQMVYEKVGALLESGKTLKWDNGRATPFYPMNASTDTVYHGSNFFLLGLFSAVNGYETPRFMTFNQAKKHGGVIRKGEKGFPVVFWKQKIFEEIVNGELKKKVIPFLRYFTVFNLDQIDKISDEFYKRQESFAEELEDPETMARDYLNREKIELHPCTGSPYYSPGEDKIGLPTLVNFTTSIRRYESLFHEIVHSTGHKSRLNRTLDTNRGDNYSKEELIAEYGAAMLLGMTGCDTGYENLAAYIKSWWKRIGENPMDLISAAGKAAKAVEFVEHGHIEEKVA